MACFILLIKHNQLKYYLKRGILQIIDVEYFNNAINQSPDDFLGSFSKFWQSFEFSLLPHISIWFDMYLSKQNDKLFEKYSSFNYGSKNAIQAFSN